jgi:alpha,alpha-trehalase
MSTDELYFVESLNGLYKEVQEQKLFPDPKYFVDCTPRTDVASLLAEYEKIRAEPNFDLLLFVTTHFVLPTDLPSGYLSANKPLLQHIEELWTVLKRNPATGGGTLVALPNPYIVPGGRFREIFYWDSYFTMLGLQVAQHIDLIESMVENFVYLIDRIGYIPNGNRTYFITRSQPPFFCMMLELLAENKGQDVLLKYFPQLQKEYAFWMDGVTTLTPQNNTFRRVVLLPDGSILNRYWDNKTITTVRPEAFPEETKLAKRSGRPEEEVHLHLRAACESGWDYSSRWLRHELQWETIETANIIPVDLNCLLLRMEETLLKMHTLAGNQEQVKQFQAATHKRLNALQQYCWNETNGFYFDYHHVDQRQTGRYSLAAAYPLFFQVATPQQAAQVAAALENKFLCDGGLVTTPIRSGQQWDAPNGWAPLQWIAYKGLQQYGFTELAGKVKERWLKNCEKVYADTGKMMEKYDVMDIAVKAGGGKYPNQDGFGWTNAVYLKMKSESPKDL